MDIRVLKDKVPSRTVQADPRRQYSQNTECPFALLQAIS